MAICDVCGNDYDKSFEVHLGGDVKTFDGFAVALPPGVDPAAYNTVVVWCETFGQFISAAEYR